MELQASKGVQELIERLKIEGIKSGEIQAQQIADKAQQRAKQIIADAKKEAESIENAARLNAERTKTSAEDAIRIAARDALLALKGQMTQLFRHELANQVSTEFNREEFLRQLLLEVCRKKIPELEADQNITVLLPSQLVSLEEIKSSSETSEGKALTQFVMAVYRDRLGQGVEFAQSPDKEGIKVRLDGQEILVDLSDKAVGDLLMQYLLPRFRALLEGYVQ